MFRVNRLNVRAGFHKRFDPLFRPHPPAPLPESPHFDPTRAAPHPAAVPSAATASVPAPPG